MNNTKQMIRNGIFFITIMVVTFMIIFHNYDFNKTINTILEVNIIYVILGVMCMFIYFLCESINVHSILLSLGKKISVPRCLKYTLIGFFFSGITPAAGGGQPMEIYYMKKDKIPVSNSTLALLVQFCCYKVIMISFGIIGAVININLLGKDFIWTFIIGLTLNSIAFIAMLIGLFGHKISKKIIDFLLNILDKINYSKYEMIKDNTYDMLENYYEGSKFIKKNKSIFIRTIFIVLIQMLAYYLVPYFVYKSFGLHNYNIINIIFMQAMLFISSSSIPLPGSVGISETIFLKIYLTIFGTSLLASAMLINRTINFYLFMLISLVVVLLTIMKHKKAKNS